MNNSERTCLTCKNKNCFIVYGVPQEQIKMKNAVVDRLINCRVADIKRNEIINYSKNRFFTAVVIKSKLCRRWQQSILSR